MKNVLHSFPQIMFCICKNQISIHLISFKNLTSIKNSKNYYLVNNYNFKINIIYIIGNPIYNFKKSALNVAKNVTCHFKSTC